MYWRGGWAQGVCDDKIEKIFSHFHKSWVSSVQDTERFIAKNTKEI